MTRRSTGNIKINKILDRLSQPFTQIGRYLNITGNQENFQGRYVLNHPFKGNLSCEAGKKYQQTLRPRLEQEAGNLANLTGWSIRDIYSKIDFSITQPKKAERNNSFWRNIWNDK